MKWVIVAILVAIVPYTYLRWHYRRPGRSFEPYHDLRERANTMRLLSAGFQRVTLRADRPADPSRRTAAAAFSAAPGGLPAPLASTLVDKPLLPAEIVWVMAAPSANALFSYPIEFTCRGADVRQQLAGAQLYIRDGAMFVVPQFERLSGGLLARSRETVVRLTVPAGTLKPGRYEVTLVGATASKTWPLEVK